MLTAEKRPCTKCGVPKDEGDFALEMKRGKPHRRADCKECRKGYLKGYYADNPAYFTAYRQEHGERQNAKSVECMRRSRGERYDFIAQLKSAPCLDCKGTFAPCVMDYDHRDPSTKVGGVSELVKTYVPWSRVLEEIAKCDLVCSCCHRLRTYHGNKNYTTRTYKANRALTDTLKSAPCLDCGQKFKPCQMDFDHVRGEKLANISQLLGGATEILLIEIAKCELVCANCHRVRTDKKPSPKTSPRTPRSDIQPRARKTFERASL